MSRWRGCNLPANQGKCTLTQISRFENFKAAVIRDGSGLTRFAQLAVWSSSRRGPTLVSPT